MALHAPVKGFSVLLAVLMAFLMVFVFVDGAVAATSPPVSPTPVGYWSYGNVKNVSVGPVRAVDGWWYQGKATFGYTVTIYDNNTSAGFELTLERTMGAAFTVEFCLPNCSSPTNWVNFSYRAWETTRAVSNFTTQGTVIEDGKGVLAIALENSSVWVAANVTESADEHLPMLGWTADGTAYLSGNVAAKASVNFTPALGLIPLSLTPGSSWTSTSQFSAVGDANYLFYFSAHGPKGRTLTIGPISGPISVTSVGNVTVDGSYATGNTIGLGGITYPVVSLIVIGPFSVREGVIFVPTAVDLFAGSTPSWESNGNASTSIAQASIDVKSNVDGHFGLGASSLTYTTNSQNPADSINADSAVAGIAPAVAATSNPISSTVVQGEPEDQAQAASAQQCLTKGTGCSSVSSSGFSLRSFFGTVIVIGAVVVIGALVAIAVVSRRRKIPPPPYPNAALYPPGAAGPVAPARAPAAPGAPTPPEEDPLNHLW